MKKFCFILLCVLMSWSLGAEALTPGELSKQAEENYQNGKYLQAIQDWKTLSEMGFINGDLYSNLASAFWRLGQVGEARFYFLKAKRLTPRDPNLEANLDFIGEKIEKPQGIVGPLALIRKIPFYRISLNLSESLWLSAIFSLILFVLLFFARLRRKNGLLLWVLLLCLPLFWGLLELWKNFEHDYFFRQAVVLVPRVRLLQAPTTDTPIQEELNEGLLLKVRKHQGDFALVKTLSGKEGWVETKDIGEI
jgi:tetratricopeptide (TPR) repeat protein